MESSTTQETKVTLVLNQEETLWLKGLVRNLVDCNPTEKDTKTVGMRKTFWNALKDINF